MMRTLFVVSAFLLTMNTAIRADDWPSSFLNLGFKQQNLYSLDTNLSRQEYEAIYRRNQRFVRSNLKSYTQHALESIGIPEPAVNLMGTALGLVTNGAKLDLNESKTLRLEFKNVDNQDRSLYFGFNVDW